MRWWWQEGDWRASEIGTACPDEAILRLPIDAAAALRDALNEALPDGEHRSGDWVPRGDFEHERQRVDALMAHFIHMMEGDCDGTECR